MTDPVTLAVLTGVALTEGIKFLYGQAGALLDSWRKRRDARAAAEAAETQTAEELPPLMPSEVLDGAVDPTRRPDPEQVALRQAELEAVLTALDPYARTFGARVADPRDASLRTEVAHARDLLEELYGQRLTLKGEQRERTGTSMNAKVHVVDATDSQVRGISGAGQASEGSQINVELTAEHLRNSTAEGVSYN